MLVVVIVSFGVEGESEVCEEEAVVMGDGGVL